jgi:hypothetical protein
MMMREAFPGCAYAWELAGAAAECVFSNGALFAPLGTFHFWPPFFKQDAPSRQEELLAEIRLLETRSRPLISVGRFQEDARRGLPAPCRPLRGGRRDCDPRLLRPWRGRSGLEVRMAMGCMEVCREATLRKSPDFRGRKCLLVAAGRGTRSSGCRERTRCSAQKVPSSASCGSLATWPLEPSVSRSTNYSTETRPRRPRRPAWRTRFGTPRPHRAICVLA